MMDRIVSRPPLPPTRVIEGARSNAAVGSVGAAPKVAPRTLPPTLVSEARDMARLPPVDSARVAMLKTAINSGNFPIKPDAIAAKMVEFDVPLQSSGAKSGTVKS
ncbi:MAG TPA: flagellar biosynthesis anti-sigma factor FlgM [Polymorphobacter sp.]|nr:flagellar biosynthesis anti-sigma factor FlgM [Polymorphobacter sp.]